MCSAQSTFKDLIKAKFKNNIKNDILLFNNDL